MFGVRCRSKGSANTVRFQVRLGLNRKISILTHQFRLSFSQFSSGQVRLALFRLAQAKLGQVRLGQVRLGQVRLGIIASMPYKKFNLGISLDKIISTANCLVSGVGLNWFTNIVQFQVRLGLNRKVSILIHQFRVMLSQVRLGQVRSGQVRLGQVRLGQV